MSRKILKIIISLLFLAVAAVTALLGIKNFMPDLFETPKYGTKPVSENSARKTPAFKKDKPEQEKNNEEPRPVYRQIPEDMTDKYGVAPVRPIKPVPYQDAIEAKYGVAPVQRPPRDMSLKYGVAPVRHIAEPAVSNVSKYGVGPILAPIEDNKKGE